MKYRTQFRLVVQLIAVYIVASNFGDLLGSAVQAAYWYSEMVQGAALSSGMRGRRFLWLQAWSGPLRELLPCIVGVLLFIFAPRIARLAIPSTRPTCPECGYDLTGRSSARCPECGTTLPGTLSPGPENASPASATGKPS